MRPASQMSSLSSFSAHSFVLVGSAPGLAQRATEAVERAFPGARLQRAETLDEAQALAGESSGAMLLLVAPSRAEVRAAVEARDQVQLPQWAVVVLGEVATTDEVISLPDGGANAETAARSLRLAFVLHRL